MSIHKRQTKKDGKRWDVRLRRPDGRMYSTTFRTKKAAQDFQAAERTDMARGIWLDPDLGRLSFAEWAGEWFSTSKPGWEPRTIERHEMAMRVHWVPAFGLAEIGSITKWSIQRRVNQMVQRYQPTSVHTYFETFKASMGAAVDLDLLGKNPCKGIRLPPRKARIKKVITAEELHRLAKAVPSRWRLLIYFGGVMGLRFGEGIGLQRRDIDLKAKTLKVERVIVDSRGHVTVRPPKTDSSTRRMFLPDDFMAEIADYIAKYQLEEPEDFLFTDSRGGPVRRSSFRRRVFQPAVEQAGLEGLTFHGLRHSAATLSVALGIDARTVQHRLGHGDPELVLGLYAHATTEADRLAAITLNEAFWPRNV